MPSDDIRLLQLADVRSSQDERVFGYSRTRALVAATLGIIACIGLSLGGYYSGSGLLYYVAAVCFVGLVVMQTFVRARFRPTNWLVRTTNAGMLVQLRSYLNYRFSTDDLTVAFLPYERMRLARAVRERRVIPERDRSARGIDAVTEVRRTVIDLELTGDLTALSRAIDEEIQRCFGNGPIRPRTRYGHVPVRMKSTTVMQIEWKATPRADVLLEILNAHGISTSTSQETIDERGLASVDRTEQEKRLLQLVEAGHKIAAIDIARRLYGYDLTEAKAFVEGLAGAGVRAEHDAAKRTL